MPKLQIPKKLLDKRIPTILGMIVLVGALISGIVFLGEGPGVFAPRATPSTTPKNIKVTNVTDNSFTVSFLTDEATPGFVKYGTSASSLDSQASDDRDQLTGTVSDYKMHHVTVRGLQQSTTYHYTLGTGSGSSFDNNGQPFTIKTAARNGAPAAAKTIYGSISTQGGTPAEGAVVYVTTATAGEMSSLVKSSGSWAIPLSNARTKDGSAYAQITDSDSLLILVQGTMPTETIEFQTTVGDSQPVPTLTFGQPAPETTTTSPTPEPSTNPSPTPPPTTAENPDMYGDEMINPDELGPSQEESIESELALEDPFADLSDLEALESEFDSEDPYSGEEGTGSESARTATIQDAAQPTPTPVTIVDLSKNEPQQVTTTQPKIVGKAAPNVTVTLQVNSETQINQTVTANENGDFELDIAALSENLEPGQHSATYSYTDPNTGETITETVTFTVADPQQLAQAEPYGSGNPYPPASTSPTPTPSATPETASQSAQASDEAEASESADATDAARTSQPATDSGIPVSGSVATTLALVFGGLFFIISGLWSFWISHQLAKEELEF